MKNYFIKAFPSRETLQGIFVVKKMFPSRKNRLFSKVVLCMLSIIMYPVLAATSYAQMTKLTVNVVDATIKEVIDKIEEQSEFTFVYDVNEVNMNEKVTANFKDQSVTEILEKVFAKNGLDYKVTDRHIVLYKQNEVPQQNTKRRLTGIITDEYGDPVIGANVIVKGTLEGTITNIDGEFSLQVSDIDILNISYIGYVTQEIRVGNNTTLMVQLNEDTQSLSEVVVVGYGTQKKVNLTGAIATTDGKVLQDRPINSITSGLQGVVAGLNVSPKNGSPGEDTKFNIRGTTSINGGDPLVLVDGVEMDINLINPNDIASVTVLKDAASSSIYGVRAAYGVVLITTKNATTEKTTVSYSGSFTLSTPTIKYKFVDNSVDHMEFMNYAMSNAGLANVYTEDHVAKAKDYRENPGSNPEWEIIGGEYLYYGYNDWKKMTLNNTAPSHRHNVNISGGTEKTKFYSSIGYIGQDGYYKLNNDKYNRLNTRLAVDNQTTSWLKLGLKALYNRSSYDDLYNYSDQNPWYRLVFTSPVRGLRWEGHPDYPEYDQYKGMYFDDQNVYSIIDQGGRKKKITTDSWLMANADIEIIKGWNAHVSFAYNRQQTNEQNHKKQIQMITSKFVLTEGQTANNELEEVNKFRDYYSFNAYTEYEKTFDRKHYLKVMAGFNQELTQYREATATRVNLLSQETPSLTLGTGDQKVKDDGYEWALRGGFFRLNYIYSDRYLVEVNGRYDGTSRFPKDNRFVFLPSFSLGWRISEESFMSWSREYLDNLKIRGSYGVLGNQLIDSKDWDGNIKYYPYISFLESEASSNYIINGMYDTKVTPSGLVSTSLTWEKAATINVGLDMTLLNSRLDLNVDWFQRTTSDMLIKVTYPQLLGTTAPPANMAALRTRGWEIGISWKDRIGKDFTYGLGLTLADAQATITKYENPTGTIASGNYRVGMKVGEIWGYETEGIFQSDEEVALHADQSFLGSNWAAGDIKYKDRNDDGVINSGTNTIEDPGDQIIIGNTTPRYTYGINANLGYKRFYMNIFMQGVGKRDFYPTSQAFWPAATQWFAVQEHFFTDSWTETNRDAYFARPVARNDKNRKAQTRFLQNASYMRMKNLTIGYDVPTYWCNKLYMSNIQIYLSGENLFEIQHVKGPFDPESAENKGNTSYPFQRSYSIGVNITF